MNQKGNANTHFKTTKKECTRRIRFLKVVSNLGSRETLLKIGLATVMSKLFYGWELFEPPEITQLESVYNNLLRTVSGAFCTSPLPALYVENGVLPFSSLMAINWARKAVWIAERETESENYLLNRANNLLIELINTQLPPVLRLYSETTKNWNEEAPKIDWSVKQHFKVGGNCREAIASFYAMKNEKYPHKKECFTDGSLSSGKIGFGVFYPTEEQENISRQLPESFSVFSAEATAIYLAVDNASTPTIVFTDSASVLSALESGLKHPIIQRIQKSANLKNVIFAWVPSHVGIAGNEKADQLANDGREGQILSIGTPKADAIKWVEREIWKRHSLEWKNNTEIKLREIKPTTSKWTDARDKKDQRILTRLRIGHTKLTHKHLLTQEEPPICDACNSVITVKHILLDCMKYDTQRMTSLHETTLEEILRNNKKNEKKVIEFIKSCDLTEEM